MILNKKYFYIALILSLVILPFNNYVIYLIPILIFLILYNILEKRELVTLMLVAQITISNQIGENIRDAQSMLFFIYLGYEYLKEYGLSFRKVIELNKYFVVFIAFFLFVIFISIFYNGFNLISITQMVRQVLFFALIYLLYCTIKKKKDASYYVNSLVISSIILSFAIFYNFATSNTMLYLLQTKGLVSEGGLFTNQAASGNLLALAIPLTFSIYYTQKKKNYTWFILISLQFIALLLTNSRAALMSLFFSTNIIFYYLSKRIFRFYVLGWISIVIIFLTSSIVFEGIEKYLRFNRVFENTRYSLWTMSFDMLKDNWLFGVGPGMFKYNMYNYLPLMIGNWEESQIRFLYDFTEYGHSHNVYLFLATELGFLGFVSIISFPILYFYLITLAQKKYNLNKVVFIKLLTFKGLLIGMLIRGIFESTGLLSYGWLERDLPIWIIITVILYYAKNDTSESFIKVKTT